MARPREFDSDTVLEQAMQVFWAKGYEAASLNDLCDVTHLNRSSLYAAFGDKRALFLETIDRYGERAVARIETALAKPLPVRDAIAGFLAGLIAQIVSGNGRSGCFIGNCAAEMAGYDRAVASRVKCNLARIEAVFRNGFERAKARGELAKDADTQELARFFVAGTQGLRLMGKTNADRDALEDIAHVMLRCIER
jgi:TetR/AcrR family transcriptional regulator, transcriptional repressor for nem operon